MHKIIAVEDALKLDEVLYIDMRSPGEFATGHIPGAINIPLFSNDERAEVGTIYKNVGVEDAKLKGLKIVSGKLPEIVDVVRAHYRKGMTVVIYCWRGGMRSKSVVTILEIMGIPSYQLLGGYKAYRRHVLDCLQNFELTPEVVVLCGSTGVGKTILLNRLLQKSIPVIDLEKLANHRGSAFGQVGLGNPETAQNFDANLLEQLKKYSCEPYIVVECESKRVGNVYLPEKLYNAMQTGIKILVTASVDTRVSRLIDEYAGISAEIHDGIVDSLKTLTRKLSVKKTEQLLKDFNEGRIKEMVEVLLVDYYDPLYGYERCNPAEYDLVVNAEDFDEATKAISSYLKQRFGR